MDEIYIRNVSHLGDVLAILNLLYSQTNPERKVIKGPTFIPELLEIFDYKFKYGGLAPTIPFHFPCEIIKFFPPITNGVLKGNRASMLFLGAGGFFNAKKEPIISIKIPPVKLPAVDPEEFVAFQFDSRSYLPDIGKVALDHNIIKKAFKKFSDLPPIGLGGKDTVIDLPYPYRLGTLSEIVTNLMKCRQFVGADSGISVLAGMLSKPCDVISLHGVEQNIQEITQFYKLMFPTVKVWRRNLKPVNDSYIKLM